jgi:hypothetical protein
MSDRKRIRFDAVSLPKGCDVRTFKSGKRYPYLAGLDVFPQFSYAFHDLLVHQSCLRVFDTDGNDSMVISFCGHRSNLD